MTLHRDEIRGHFVYEIQQFDPVIRSEVIGCDLGPRLHLQATAAHLTPDDARELAAALTWWADRKRRPAHYPWATSPVHGDGFPAGAARGQTEKAESPGQAGNADRGSRTRRF